MHGGRNSDTLDTCKFDKEIIVKIEFFTNPAALKVGSLVAGPSALTDIRLFGMIGTPLYEITEIVNRRVLWVKMHYAKLRRLSDGEVLKIDLNSPSDFFARSTPTDLRENWAQINPI
ncbi:MAG: hypothetical protein WC814_02755 [Candidatus Paceibacterota bacterium]|jgi:hypothetical protein